MEEIREFTVWNKIPWARLHTYVFDLQKKIYQCAKRDETAKVRRFQEELVNSEHAKLIAIRIITQDNREKKIEGVDGISELKPTERLQMVSKMVLDGKASPIRRIPIDRTDGKMRVLGVLTMEDRAKQCLVKMALEPEWESKFETNSYGFRPGYSTSDVKFMIGSQLGRHSKYFFDVDMRGCFENITHEYLLKKLNTTEMFQQQIEAWLKAGIMADLGEDVYEYETSESKTPRGGVISSLLINITLHGLENTLTTQVGKKNAVRVIRYADHFVVFTKSMDDIFKAKKILIEFLKPMGVKLLEEKTVIGHSKELSGTQKTQGLDFLGYHFQNIQRSDYRGVKSTQGNKTIYTKLLTIPSEDAIIKHKANLMGTLENFKSAPLKMLFQKLASIIGKWAWYYSITQVHKTFSNLDAWFEEKLWEWAIRRFKSRENAEHKCFSLKGNTLFGCKEDGQIFALDRHEKTKVRQYIKVTPGVSVYDGSTAVYFSKRIRHTHPRNRNLIPIFEKQDYSCAFCGLRFQPMDLLELHHVQNEKKERTNETQWVHAHCHDQVHG